MIYPAGCELVSTMAPRKSDEIERVMQEPGMLGELKLPDIGKKERSQELDVKENSSTLILLTGSSFLHPPQCLEPTSTRMTSSDASDPTPT